MSNNDYAMQRGWPGRVALPPADRVEDPLTDSVESDMEFLSRVQWLKGYANARRAAEEGKRDYAVGVLWRMIALTLDTAERYLIVAAKADEERIHGR